jgi:hypothetical protein
VMKWTAIDRFKALKYNRNLFFISNQTKSYLSAAPLIFVVGEANFSRNDGSNILLSIALWRRLIAEKNIRFGISLIPSTTDNKTLIFATFPSEESSH